MYLRRPALYGFRVSVVLSENEPCELGVSCKGELIISGGSDVPASVNATFYPGKLILDLLNVTSNLDSSYSR